MHKIVVKIKHSLSLNYNYLKKCLHIINDYNRFYIPVVVILSTILGIIPALSLTVMQKILNNLQLGLNGQDDFFTKILYFIIVYILLDLISLLLNNFSIYFSTKANANIELNIKLTIHKKSSSLNLKDYENSNVYNLISLAESGSSGKITEYFGLLITIFRQIISIISSAIILFKFNFILPFVILIIPFIRYLFSLKYGKKQVDLKKKQVPYNRKAMYYAHLLSSDIAFKEIKTFKLENYFLKIIKELLKKVVNQELKLLKQSQRIFLIIDFLDLLVFAFIFSILVYFGYIGLILIGDVITYIRSMTNMKNYISTIFSSISSLIKDTYYLELYFNFIALESLDNNDNKVQKELINEIHEIKIENLSYKYKTDYILKDINLTVSKGDSIAIVGKNGSGKTTLSKILLGLYSDYEGHIYINGIDLKFINKTCYNKLLSAVFQDFVRFQATAIENIAFGNLTLINNTNYLIKIIEELELPQEIKENPSLMLGSWFENGKQLSIGEWQKVAIARSLIRKSDLYIFDELNASLDVLAEYDLLQLCSDYTKDKITIFITHRLSNIYKFVNRIIVIDNGEIVEDGTHEELLENGKLYKDLYHKSV